HRKGLLMYLEQKFHFGKEHRYLAGGAYLPIEPGFPESRRNHMLQDSQVAVLLTEMEFLFQVHEQAFPVMALDLQLDQLPAVEAAPTCEAGPESPAYVIYTSGTSGKPKGITIPHRGLVHYQAWFADAYLPNTPNTTLLFNSVAFDLGYTTYWSSLLFGGKLVILPDPGYFDAEAFVQALVEHQVTYLKLTPTHFRLAFSHLKELPILEHLKLVVLGGEAMHYDLLAQFQGQNPHVQLVNHYGPSETTIGCLTQPMGLLKGEEKQIIGKAIDNSYAYILNEALEPLPPGVPGELCLSGPGVALGYQNLPELNQKRFLSDLPFHSGPFAVYRTGDKAVMYETGQVEFLGRIDQQISLNGYRIEPEEIEKVLKTKEGIQKVYIRKHQVHGTEALAAYFTASISISSTECAEVCKQSLPDFMVPQYYVQMEALPVSANGKIDVNRLPSPEKELVNTETDDEATELEGLLLNIWAQVLGMKVTLHADFFESGGDSIKAVQVAAMGYEAGYRLDVKHLFENPTVHQLAQVIQPLSRQSDQGQAEGPIPLTPIQRQLFAESPQPAHFNQALALRLPQGCTPEQVQSALDALVDHHDTLRLTFPSQAGSIQQSYSDVRLHLEEKSFTSQADFTSHAQAIQRSFSLESGPLIKAVYGTMEPQNVLLLVIHHLVIDGVSWRILLEDLDRLLIKQTALPPKTDSYQYWQRCLAQYFENQDYTETRYFWQEQMESLQGGHPSTTMGEMQSLHFSLSSTHTQKALTIAEKGLDINSLLVAALYSSYQSEMESQTLQILLEGHGRDLPFAEVNITRTLGWFTVHYPITLHPKDGGNDQQLIKQIQATLKKVEVHKVGYLQERYPDIKSSGLPHPQIKFNYLGQLQESAAEGLQILDWEVGDTQAPDTPVHQPYLVSGIVKQGQLHLTLTYNPKAPAASKVASWCSTLEKTLQTWLDQEMVLDQPEQDFTYSELSDKDLDSLFV
ncbi:MAG: amino acid adenylation domain-containing protein, partial [Bacteroidota bacterium]